MALAMHGRGAIRITVVLLSLVGMPLRSPAVPARKRSAPYRRKAAVRSRKAAVRSSRRGGRRRYGARLRRRRPVRRAAGLRLEGARVIQIQQALIKAGYLAGQPTGVWDEASRQAMRRYQAANGFDVTGLPEAKPLMKLGLGPHPLPPGVAAPTPPDVDPNPPADFPHPSASRPPASNPPARSKS